MMLLRMLASTTRFFFVVASILTINKIKEHIKRNVLTKTSTEVEDEKRKQQQQ